VQTVFGKSEGAEYKGTGECSKPKESVMSIGSNLSTKDHGKVDVVQKVMFAFLRRQTVHIDDVVADYCPHEGLRFSDNRDKQPVFYVASLDGEVTDVGQAALDLYEYVTGRSLERPSAINSWTGRESDTTWKSSIAETFNL
jgi:hypothetical protein